MSLLILALFLIVVITSLLGHRIRSTTRLPPGPPGAPLIGNLLDIRNKSLPKQLTIWAAHYGDIYSYHVGQTAVVVLSSPTALEDLCVKKGNVYSSRPRPSKQTDLCTKDTKIVNMEYSDRWRKQRKIVHQLLSINNSKIFKPYQEFETRAMLANLLDDPGSFYDEMGRYSSSVTFSLLYVE
jgi:cytochrome P450